MQPFPWHHALLTSLLLIGAATALPGAEADPNPATSTGAADDPVAAIRRFRAAPGLKIDLFAAEPMVQNVVSFAFDEQGRCYVVESFRRRTSVFDIRGLGEWLDKDFSFRTVEDRADFFRHTLSSTNPKLPDFLKTKRNLLSDYNRDGTVDWHDLEVQSERIRLIVDTNHDGHADAAATLAEGFDGLTSGVAAGVLARKGEVWFTCIPDLWKITSDELRTTNGMPSAAALPVNPHLVNRKSQITNLLHGFGVHIAFGGHDLHGLKMGPDGKIYFSIADRGISTNLWDRIVDKWPGLTMEGLADSGAVLRCNPDGTEFEVICIGLRNPQELAFDEFGNLFTGENNGDGGDKARWIHVVEGADYGWRMGWQWLPKLGAWNSEMLWGMEGTNTSSYYLPPVAHIGAGPSGVAYYPGTGLPARYDRHFFMCDFRGGPNSVVRSFALRPKGASFEAYDETEFVSGFLCTDVDFGPDGAVYVSDWVKGWDKTDKGRIYRVFDPSTVNDPAVLEVKKLLADGMEKSSNEELARLLGHRDMRVRLEAQSELAARPKSDRDPAVALLISTALKSKDRLPRLHAVWGVNQIARRLPVEQLVEELGAMLVLLNDPDSVIRSSACEMFQRAAFVNAIKPITKLLLDPDAAVAAHAALALSREFRVHQSNRLLQETAEKIKDQVGPQFDRLRNAFTGGSSVRGTRGFMWKRPYDELLSVFASAGKNQDANLRHAGVELLAFNWKGELRNSAGFFTPGSFGYAPFITSSNPDVRMGAVLALRRLQRPEVAQFLHDSDPQIALEAARAIHDVPIPAASFALSEKLPYALWRPETHMRAAMAASVPLLRRALNAHFRLGQKQNAQALVLFAGNTAAPEALRVEALELLALWPKPPGRDRIVGLWRPLPPRDGAVAARELEAFRDRFETNAPPAVQLALKKTAAALAARQEEVVAPTMSSEEFAKLSKSLDTGTLVEKQNALAALATVNDAGAAKLLSEWLDKLVAGQVAKELQLDVLDAVQKSQSLVTSTATKEKLTRYDAARDVKDALAKWRECLQGGNAEEGKRLFIERQDAACLRCHKINGEGGEVGPEMAGIGRRQTREYILESMLYPNKTIAPGFETVMVALKNGTSYAGLVKAENDTGLVINSAEDGLITVQKADLQARDRGLSSMPEEMGNVLSKSDLRNLVEFLSTLK